MKNLKLVATLVVLGAASSVLVLAQTAGKPAAGAAAAQPRQQLVRVATLNNIQANQEFQKNVQVMQANRAKAVELKQQIDQAFGSKKAELQKQMDELMDRLNDDNKKMVDAYGFSLNRNYVLVTEKAHIFMFVSPEEAKAIEAQNAKNPPKTSPNGQN